VSFLTPILTAFPTRTFNVRRPFGSYDASGEWDDGIEDTFEGVICHVQPISGEQLRALAQEFHCTQVLKVFSKFALQANDRMSEIDCQHGEEEWTVAQAENWPHPDDISGHHECIISRGVRQ